MRLASFNLENLFDRAKAFNEDTIAEGKVDGNDDRGIDVGLMTRFDVGTIRSHGDDLKDGLRIFSRDCPEYEIVLPSGDTLLLLINQVDTAGVFRRGVWGGVNGDLFEHFPEMTKPIHAASDHAALFVDLDI